MKTHYERLSALDASFLEIEDQSTHMHVAATLLLTSHEAKVEARAFLKMVEYRKSDAVANVRIARMSDLQEKRGML